MFCSNCGKPNPGEMAFCAECGTPSVRTPTSPQASSIPAQSFQQPAQQMSAFLNTNSPTVTSGLAIAALVVVFFFPLIGLILGYVAQNDIRVSQGRKTGQGLATASIIMGWIFTVLGVFWFFLYMSYLMSY